MRGRRVRRGGEREGDEGFEEQQEGRGQEEEEERRRVSGKYFE